MEWHEIKRNKSNTTLQPLWLRIQKVPEEKLQEKLKLQPTPPAAHVMKELELAGKSIRRLSVTYLPPFPLLFFVYTSIVL